ncbi:MAG: hypothetical protein POELPBGB_00923 [Bacteroidia bacterium]|nr:hypothetical protein [Bacteroidia bacterium]
MQNKLDKLNELNELLKSGAISQQEFESLKSEILKDSKIYSTPSTNPPLSETHSNSNEQINKEKISLVSFKDHEGKFINAPEIKYLNFKDISNSESQQLKPFIRLKQIYAPAEMTRDEINIGNKIFTISEIAQMNSERPGFNYAFGSIVSVLAAGLALYFMTISPCLIIFGAGTGGAAALFISISTLTKADATKLDKTFSYIAITLIVIACIVYASAFS